MPDLLRRTGSDPEVQDPSEAFLTGILSSPMIRRPVGPQQPPVMGTGMAQALQQAAPWLFAGYDWTDPENQSVLDPWYRSPIRHLLNMYAPRDPASQAMGMAMPMQTGEAGGLVGRATTGAGKAFKNLAERYPEFAKRFKELQGRLPKAEGSLSKTLAVTPPEGFERRASGILVPRGNRPLPSNLWLPGGQQGIPGMGGFSPEDFIELPSGVYGLKPGVQGRLAHSYEMAGSNPAEWAGAGSEELLRAFGGNKDLMNRFLRVWAAMTPGTEVPGSTREAVSTWLHLLQSGFKPLSGPEELGRLRPTPVGLPETKWWNTNLALKGEELSGDKVAAMAEFMLGNPRLPIDRHMLHALGTQMGTVGPTLDPEMRPLRAFFGQTEGLPQTGGPLKNVMKGPTGQTKTFPGIYRRYEQALRETLEAMAPGRSVNDIFAQTWEGTRMLKGEKFQGGVIDILKKKGLLEAGAMMDPKQLVKALRENGWSAAAIAGLLTTLGHQRQQQEPEPRQAGGDVEPGRSYVVGEQGPEIIVPKQDGVVIPNQQGQGGGGEEGAMKQVMAALSAQGSIPLSLLSHPLIQRLVLALSQKAPAGKGKAKTKPSTPPPPSGGGQGGADISPMLQRLVQAIASLPSRQAGGPVEAGQPFVAGEKGPETLSIPGLPEVGPPSMARITGNPQMDAALRVLSADPYFKSQIQSAHTLGVMPMAEGLGTPDVPFGAVGYTTGPDALTKANAPGDVRLNPLMLMLAPTGDIQQTLAHEAGGHIPQNREGQYGGWFVGRQGIENNADARMIPHLRDLIGQQDPAATRGNWTPPPAFEALRQELLKLAGHPNAQTTWPALPERVQVRQAGGPVEAGKPYLVGETKPETFTPTTNPAPAPVQDKSQPYIIKDPVGKPYGFTMEVPPETAAKFVMAEYQKNKAQQPSAMSRFGSGLYQSTVGGVLGAGSAVLDAAGSEHPVKALAGMAEDVVWTPTKEHLEAATAARKKGDWGAWATNMAFAVPIIGPTAEQVTGQIKSGDWAGAAGNLAGTGLMYGVGKLGKITPARRAKPTVPLSLAERSKSRLAQYAETLTERTLPGSRVYDEFRKEQQAGLQAMGEAAANGITQGVSTRGQSASFVGTKVEAGIEQGRQALRAQARGMYGQIDNLASQYNVQPSTASLKAVARPLLKRITNEATVMPPQELARTRRLLTKIVRSPDRVSFQTLQDVKSDLGKMARSYNDLIPGKAAGAAERLHAAATSAILTAADQVPGLKQLVLDADKMYAEGKRTFNDSFIKRLVRASPETVPALIRAGDVEDIGLLQKALWNQPEVFNAARAYILRDLMTEVTEPPINMGARQRAGMTLGGRPPVTSPQVKGLRLADSLRSMGTDKGEALFGQAGFQSLIDIANLAEKVNPLRVEHMVPGLVAGGVNVAILAPILKGQKLMAVPGMLETTVGQAAGIYAGFYGLAHLLTTQPGRGIYRSFLQSLSRGNRPMALALGTRITALIDQREGQNPSVWAAAGDTGAPTPP